MKKIITLLLVMIVSLNCYSQFSKTHYIPPLTAATYMSSTTIDVDQYIYISTPSTTPVNVTITPLGGKLPVATRTVTNLNPWVYMISAPSIPDPSSTPTKPKPDKPAKDGQDTQLFVPSRLLGTVLNDRGYLIEASDYVYANVRISSKVSGGGSSQAGGLVAKGISAYGTEFRLGGMENRGVMGSGNGEALMNFASFIATEDNTTVTITLPRAPAGTFMYPKTMNGNYPYGYPFPNSDFYYPPATAPAPTSYTTPTSKNHIYNGPITVTLNKNESYVIAMENSSDTTFESNYMLGGLITSDRNIVVNSGSMGGTSQIKGEGLANSAPYNSAGKDFGFDQIVGSDKIGKEYIFVGGSGMAAATKAYDLERAIIIANEDGTQVYKNGSATTVPPGTLVKTLNKGEYYVFNGNDYINGNLYVNTSKNVFAYQAIAGIGSSGKADAGNQNMYFVPPLNCATPSAVDNIPLINEIGLATTPPNIYATFPTQVSTNGKVIYPNTIVNIVTQQFLTDGVTPNDVYINGTKLVPSPIVTRALVTGKNDIKFVVYSYKTPGGPMAVSSSAQVYVSFYGSNDNAAFGSYFSGFDTKPSIAPIDKNSVSNSICNTTLKATSAVSTDKFEWQFSTVKTGPYTAIPGATGNTFTPSATNMGPGYYSVTKISACTSTSSDPIAVSACPEDTDKDGVFNNIDIDSDNDGITNTNESYGNKGIDVSGTSGTVTAGSGSDIYNNSYTTTTTTTGTGNTFTGNTNGSFTTSLTAGSTNSVSYELKFPSKAISAALQYSSGMSTLDMTNAAFEVQTGLTTTITISNPTGQLLIDTDNDGIYESGVKEFSSFDIKFKLNIPSGATPDFKIQTYMANSIIFTHTNISNSQTNSATGFSFVALSVPKNSDGTDSDDQVDTDSDNDGILDIEEGQSGNKTIALPLVDTNKNGLADNFEPVVAPIDTDGDGVPDFIDSDSDNDGILDSIEGIADSSTPANGIKNYRETDSDGDACKDVVEAGFTDPDNDGILGTSPVTVDAKGKVTGVTYPTSVSNYYTIAATVPDVNLTLNSKCSTKYAEITANHATDSGLTYKWQYTTDNGTTWTYITSSNAGSTFTDYTSQILKIFGYDKVSQYKYRVELSKAENICSKKYSDPPLEIKDANEPSAANVTFAKCGTDMNGVATFDLTSIPSTDIDKTNPPPPTPNTITFHTTKAGADNNTNIISDPTQFSNTTSPFYMDVYARVQNSSGCAVSSTVSLSVTAKLPGNYVVPSAPATLCDDFDAGISTSTDGKSVFNILKTKTAIEDEFKNLTPTKPLAYTVYFYTDPLAAANNDIAKAITTNLDKYRNTTRDQETIYVRINSNDTSVPTTCYNSAQFVLNVEALPTAYAVGPFNECDNNSDSPFTAPNDGKYAFSFTTSLESQILKGQTGASVTFYDQAGVQLPSPLPNPFIVTGAQKISAIVANTDPNGAKCAAEPIFIDFKVYSAPVVNPNVVYSVCDTDTGTNMTFDGLATFNLPSLNDGEISTETNLTYTYYSDITGAQNADPSKLISNPGAFRNDTPPSTPYTSTVYARVQNVAGCFSVATVTLNAISTFPVSYATAKQPNPACDEGNGIATFYLKDAKDDIEANIKAPGYTFAYYGTQDDFNTKRNEITNFISYKNPSQNELGVWVRVTNTFGTCESSGKYITLNVEALPDASVTKKSYKECDDNTDGQFSFINSVDDQVRKNRNDVTVEYYNDLTGALLFPSNSKFPSPYSTGNLTVRAKVINKTLQLCEDEELIVFQVDVKPVVVDPSTNPLTFTECDDEADPINQDGKVYFNTSSIESTILAAQTDPQAMIISYFDAAKNPLKDANGALISSPFPSTFISGTQTVKYKVENKNNLNNVGCTAEGEIHFTVNPLPKIDLNADGSDDKTICTNADAPADMLTADLDAGLQNGANSSDYTYVWRLDGNTLPETSSNLSDVSTPGVYTVEVTTKTGDCNRTRSIVVNPSESPKIDSVTVTDLVDDNTITVHLAPGLTGNYGYSLDDEIGYYQPSNVFTNVSPGTHQVYVRDHNGCGTVSRVTVVIGVPKFFTPNGDGYNDTWNIKGVDADTKYTIFIYDRYGKLLKELIPESIQGWDGIFNGSALPGSDYWYSLKLDNGREAKGHFSLKR